MNDKIIGILCLISSFALVFVLMPFLIKYLKKRQLNQTVSEYAIQEYKDKAKTPTMGGVLFIICPVIAFCLINPSALVDHKVLIIILSYISYSIVGFIDDATIVFKKNNNGISATLRLVLEFIFISIIFFVFREDINTYVLIPFTNIKVEFGFIYFPFIALVYMAEANAVNFTDGMDGLCAGVSFIALIPFILIARAVDTNISIFLLSVIGALLAYLYYNYHPAKIFMGDSGSLGLGALFAALAMVLDKEIALFFIGGIFVIEMLCVCIQQVSVRLFHKKVFSYTPIHYAFSLKGHKETKIVKGFYLVGVILAIIGFIIGIN